MKAVGSVVEQGEPVLIFPEGVWKDDFDPEAELESGAATIAAKYNLPIVPVYIKGGKSWQPGEKVSVAFGTYFETEGKSKEEITEEIRKGITDLYEPEKPD